MRTRVLHGWSTFIVGLAIAGSAQAQAVTMARWRNADTRRGTFYFGVSGGETCNPSTNICGLKSGTQIITYQKSGEDQIWGATESWFSIGIQDLFPDIANGNPLCVTPQNESTSRNANLIVKDCQFDVQDPNVPAPSDNGDWNQVWAAIPAESVGAPYTGCFAFEKGLQNDPAGPTVMSVYQGIVQNGSHVVQWPLCQPGSNACGNPPNAFHPDQWWCPE